MKHLLTLRATVLLGAVVLSACGGGGGNTTAEPVPLPAAPQVPAAPAAPVTLEAGVDSLMASYLSNGTSAATVTVMRGGVVLLEKGYGYFDASHTRPVLADSMMVAGGPIKPVTAAAIQKLAAAGVLKTSDHVFCTGSNSPCWLPQSLLAANADARVKDITLAHLIAHRGGWDAAMASDPIDHELDIAATIGGKVPQREDVVRYWMQRPLQFAPGERSAYSNFGYLLLGLVIEQASKMSYIDYLKTQIFVPLGVPASDIDLLAARRSGRGPREPAYTTNGMTAPSVMQPGTNAPIDDGYINTVNYAAAGLSVTSTRALARFASTYRIDAGADGIDGPLSGTLLNGATVASVRSGDVGYASSVVRQLPSGITYAVLTNAPSAPGDIQRKIDAAIQAAGL